MFRRGGIFTAPFLRNRCEPGDTFFTLTQTYMIHDDDTSHIVRNLLVLLLNKKGSVSRHRLSIAVGRVNLRIGIDSGLLPPAHNPASFAGNEFIVPGREEGERQPPVGARLKLLHHI